MLTHSTTQQSAPPPPPLFFTPFFFLLPFFPPRLHLYFIAFFPSFLPHFPIFPFPHSPFSLLTFFPFDLIPSPFLLENASLSFLLSSPPCLVSFFLCFCCLLHFSQLLFLSVCFFPFLELFLSSYSLSTFLFHFLFLPPPLSSHHTFPLTAFLVSLHFPTLIFSLFFTFIIPCFLSLYPPLFLLFSPLLFTLHPSLIFSPSSFLLTSLFPIFLSSFFSPACYLAFGSFSFPSPLSSLLLSNLF